MNEPKTSSIAPVLASLGCIGVAAASTVVPSVATGTLPLAAVVLTSLAGNLSVNIASDQLLKISPNALRKKLLPDPSDLTNHDLQKALRDSLKTALINCFAVYKERIPASASTGSHLKALEKKIRLICDELDERFLEEVGQYIHEDDVLDYQEGFDLAINDQLIKYLFDQESFEHHGRVFSPLLREQLPLLISAAFAEELKTNTRCWVAYQRSVLQDLRSSQYQTLEELGDLNQRIDKLFEYLSGLELLGQQVDDKTFNELVKGNEVVKNLMEHSMASIEHFQESFSRKIDQLGEVLLSEMDAQRDLINLNNRILAEVHASLLGGTQNTLTDVEDIKQRVLPTYLRHLVETYSLIQLPSIERKARRATIPLDNVYVALQLTKDRISRNFQYASQYIRQEVRRTQLRNNKELSQDEVDNISASILEQNPTLRTFDQEELQAVSQRNIDLAQLFTQERYAVLLGDPGSGKSTIVKWLALHLANSLISGQSDGRVYVRPDQICSRVASEGETITDLGPQRLPVLINISEYADFYEQRNGRTDRGLIDFCGIHLPTIPGITAEDTNRLIRHYLADNRAVVLLDGMDEVVPQSRKHLTRNSKVYNLLD
jgi:ABC-type multidrug transport system fused ATPase/permease subunit